MIIEDTESFENVFVSNYWYDADGERTVKSSGENEAIYVNYRASRVQCQVCLSIAEAQPIITESNSEFSGGNTGTARFSLSYLNLATSQAMVQTRDEYRMQAMARTRAVNGNFKPNDDYEKIQFYYHPDHLGSSSYITNYDRSKRWKNAKESIYNG